jgi:hypothetical protein
MYFDLRIKRLNFKKFQNDFNFYKNKNLFIYFFFEPLILLYSEFIIYKKNLINYKLNGFFFNKKKNFFNININNLLNYNSFYCILFNELTNTNYKIYLHFFLFLKKNNILNFINALNKRAVLMDFFIKNLKFIFIIYKEIIYTYDYLNFFFTVLINFYEFNYFFIYIYKNLIIKILKFFLCLH